MTRSRPIREWTPTNYHSLTRGIYSWWNYQSRWPTAARDRIEQQPKQSSDDDKDLLDARNHQRRFRKTAEALSADKQAKNHNTAWIHERTAEASNGPCGTALGRDHQEED